MGNDPPEKDDQSPPRCIDCARSFMAKRAYMVDGKLSQTFVYVCGFTDQTVGSVPDLKNINYIPQVSKCDFVKHEAGQSLNSLLTERNNFASPERRPFRCMECSRIMRRLEPVTGSGKPLRIHIFYCGLSKQRIGTVKDMERASFSFLPGNCDFVEHKGKRQFSNDPGEVEMKAFR